MAMVGMEQSQLLVLGGATSEDEEATRPVHTRRSGVPFKRGGAFAAVLLAAVGCVALYNHQSDVVGAEPALARPEEAIEAQYIGLPFLAPPALPGLAPGLPWMPGGLVVAPYVPAKNFPAPDVVPEMCTDGWVFEFTTKLIVASKAGNQTILETSTGAFALSVANSVIAFKVMTYNFGEVDVSETMDCDATYEVTVGKTGEAICLTLCKWEVGQETNSSATCEKKDPQCAYPPPLMPLSSFQMIQPGEISWGTGSVVNITDYQQTKGFVSLSFTLANVPYQHLWEDKSNHWGKLTFHLQGLLAALAKHVVTPERVQISPAMPALEANGTVFQATIIADHARACDVQAHLQYYISNGKELSETTFGVATTMTLDTVDSKLTDAGLFSIEIPGKPMPCISFGCRLSAPHQNLPEGAMCLGGGCEETCCEPAYSRKALPYVRPGTTTTTTTTSKYMDSFVENGTEEVRGAFWPKDIWETYYKNPLPADSTKTIKGKVSFDCYAEACCKLAGPLGVVPMPQPWPADLGLLMDAEWKYVNATSLKTCEEVCSKDETCTGMTFYTESRQCATFDGGLGKTGCAVGASGASPWRYPKEACGGATTCGALRQPIDSPKPPAVLRKPLGADDPNDFNVVDWSKGLPGPNSTTTTTTTNLFDKVMASLAALDAMKQAYWDAKNQSWRNYVAVKSELNTDGLDFEFEIEVNLKKPVGNLSALDFGPFNVLSADFDAISVDAMHGTKPGTRRMQFTGKMLTGSAGHCTVSAAWEVPHEGVYSMTISKTKDKCCIQVKPAKGVGALMAKFAPKRGKDLGGLMAKLAEKAPWAKPTCVSRSKDVSAAAFQIRPVTNVLRVDNEQVLSDKFVQKKGGLTMSFDLEGVSFTKVVEECKCEADLKKAIQQSIAYAAGVGITYEQVNVALRGRSTSIAKLMLPGLLDKATFNLVPKVTAESKEARLKLQSLESGKPWYKNTGSEDDRKKSDDLAKAGYAGLEGLNKGKIKKLANPFQAAFHAQPSARHLLGAPAAGPLRVQVSLSGCGTCASARTALTQPDAIATIVDRIISVIGSGFAGKGSTGYVALTNAVSPAVPMSCRNVECAEPFTINDPTQRCYGSSCNTACCKPRTCSQVTCGAGMVKNAISLSYGLTCSNETECGNTCCVVLCKDHECPSGMCNKDNSWMAVGTPEQADKVCCKKNEAQCCDAPIAWCIACLKCMDKKAFCLAQVVAFMPKFGGFPHRRLSEDMSPMDGGDEFLQLPPPGAITDAELSGGLVAETEPLGVSAEELEADHRDSAKSVAETLKRIDGSRGLRGNAEEAKEKYRRLQSLERSSMVAGMMDLASKAAAYRLKSLPPAAAPAPLAATKDAWKDSWNQVVLNAQAKSPGMVKGCTGCTARACKYHFKSIFLLHRGCFRHPKSANTVQVLTDTRQAVSCGEDGLCWVWKINSGTPTQVFFPNRDTPTQKSLFPVLTVSVLNDATYILSAGAGDVNGSTGNAYIWDWQFGVQRTTLSCKQGTFLSSADMAAYRLVLLGCKNSYTYIWNWGGGNSVALPYYARTTDEIIAGIQGQVNTYKNNALDGMARLVAEKVMMTETSFLDVVMKVDPSLKSDLKFLSNLHNFFTKNRMGSVRAIAYVPTGLRFATGHGDGKVRYWNADSGQLLMVMCGHQGPVNAIVASPKAQQALSGGDDGTVRLWCLKTGMQLLMLSQPYGGPVRALAMIPGGNRVVVGSDDGYIRIWNINNGLLICSINTGGGVIRGLAVNPSNPLGQILVASMDGYVRVYDPDSIGDAIR